MKHPLPRILACICLALPLGFAPAAHAQAPVKAEQFTLANGLTLIVKPDRRAPTAVHMLWVRAGAMDEVDGTSGVAHVLEHMLFKGTPDVGVGEFSRRVAALAGAKTPSPRVTTQAITSRSRRAGWKT
jgi:zinc protease